MGDGASLRMLAIGRTMRPYDDAHLLAVVLLLVGTAVAVRVGRRSHAGGRGRRVDVALGWACMAAWLAVIAQDLVPSRLSWGWSLPLHICDLAGFTAGVGLLTDRRWARTFTIYVGLGLSTIAFVLPVMPRGPTSPLYWIYFGGHGAIVVSAVYDVLVRGYRGDRRDLRTAVLLIPIYALIVVPVDFWLGVNYGYLGPGDSGPRGMFRRIGPWPHRVPVLMAAAAGMMVVVHMAIRRLGPRAAFAPVEPGAGRMIAA